MSRSPVRRRLALKGLGCMIILGPQGVCQAIASTSLDPNRQGPSEANQELTMLSKGKGRGSVSTKMEVDDDASARQRDLTSGRADDDEGSDREEEVVALIDNGSKGLPQQEDEPRSSSPCDDDIDHEPTPQLAEETGDVDMTT